MTTNTTPADHGRHLLAAPDPAELLAQARLSLREIPSDCLLLAGGGGPATAPMLTRSSLADLLGPHGGEDLARHLALMSAQGSASGHALIVLGDGHQSLLGPVVHDVLRRAGELLCAAVDAQDPSAGSGPFELLSIRGAAAGCCWEIERPPSPAGGGELRLSRTAALREFTDTRAAASAVLDGHQMPRCEDEQEDLLEIGRRLEVPAADLASSADPGELFALARAVLDALLAPAGTLGERDRMTKCEQVAALLSAVAVDRLHWDLLARCVEHDGERTIERETLLQQLVSDPRWRPHADVCAGGSWYIGLERLRVVAAGAMERAAVPERSTARSAWRALTTLLVLLAWWNHRFATAGRLVDELREREPESTLAPLLSRMTDTPIFPAWWPGA
ncbi:hypothetical protein ACT3SP_16895 [Brachybacterium sp. AOP43-C2-M15]|uniref:hypothetical protein n=1 Tax=Brachybacterium sp. AOP43-C2-M15 TaxID=3457661 RepID=UPI00403409EC